MPRAYVSYQYILLQDGWHRMGGSTQPYSKGNCLMIAALRYSPLSNAASASRSFTKATSQLMHCSMSPVSATSTVECM